MAQDKEKTTASIYDMKLPDITGETIDFNQYKGKTLLIVNTASKCGFTDQYEDLEDLYQKFENQGLIVLGFPSNDFGSQEPENNDAIKKFCKLKYGVTFPLFKKSNIKGDNKNELYKLLTEYSGKKYQGEVGWNFVKFLINKQGEVVGRYSSIKNPAGLEKIIKKIL